MAKPPMLDIASNLLGRSDNPIALIAEAIAIAVDRNRRTGERGPTRPDRQRGYDGHSTRAASASAAGFREPVDSRALSSRFSSTRTEIRRAKSGATGHPPAWPGHVHEPAARVRCKRRIGSCHGERVHPLALTISSACERPINSIVLEQ